MKANDEILMILVVVIAVSVGYFWLSNTVVSTANVAETGLVEQLKMQSQRAIIESASGNVIVIRNIGTMKIPADSLKFYYGDAPADVTTCSGIFVLPDEVITCNMQLPCTSRTVELVSPAIKDYMDC